MMKRTISGMTGTGSLAHNRRDFIAENVNQNRVYLNICYRDENLKDVYKELFDESVERYNVGKRNDRKITNYYDKIQHGKQEKLFHEVIFQIGNNKDMAAGTPEGDLAVKVLDEYMQDFQRRNPTLRVFCCYLHQDEATPHLNIDFVPYVTGWKGKGMDTRGSLKQALKSLGFQGGAKHDTELNQWINHEKEVLAEIMERHEIEWEQKGTHEEHLDVYNFKKKERAKEGKGNTEWKQWAEAEKEDIALIMSRYGIDWKKKDTHNKHLSVLDYKKQERAKEVAALEEEIEGAQVVLELKEERIDSLEKEIESKQDSFRKEQSEVQKKLDDTIAENQKLQTEQAQFELEEAGRLKKELLGAVDGDDYLKEHVIELRYKNHMLREENRSLKDKLEKAYEFMKQFVIGGINLLEKFMEWIGEKVKDVGRER